MKKRIYKKIIALTLCCVLSVGVILPTYASSTTFDITVTPSNSKDDDNISPKAKKDAGSAYEGIFYVTPSYFSCSASKGTIRVFSMRKNYPTTVISNGLVLSKTHVKKTKTALYNYKVPAKEYYFLHSAYYTGTANYIRAQGKYTP